MTAVGRPLGRTAADSATVVPGGVLDLRVRDGLVPMVDDAWVYQRGFGTTTPASGPQSLRPAPHAFLADGRLVATRAYPLDALLPPHGRPEPGGPHPTSPGRATVRRSTWASFLPPRVLLAESGATLRLRLTNHLALPHELRIEGVATTGSVPAGATATLEVPAPAPGTYVVHDPGGGSVERLLGLHAVPLVVDPAAPWRLAAGLTEFERQWVWICQDVDPVWCARARAGEVVDAERTPPVPRYFMLNDRSGFRSLGLTRDEAYNDHVHEDTLPSGCAREVDLRDFSPPQPGPAAPGQLVRMVNVGAVVHQLHFHGNHVWTVRRNGLDFPRSRGRVDAAGHLVLQQWEDVAELDPMARKDVVLPLRRPPEVLDPVWDARREEWEYPVHCHAEPSQTAAGGLYPGGLVAGWTLAAPDGSHRDHPTYPSQVAFAASQPREGRPETHFRQRPDRRFRLDFFSRELRFPDGSEHEVWSFETEASGRRFPAPLLRVTEGEVVHVEIKPSKRTHTIHHHRMEPDPRNDGVGHTSFEVSGSYTY